MATAAGVAIAGYVVSWGTVATVALTVASGAMAYVSYKKAKEGIGSEVAERKQIVRSSSQPENTIYGEIRSSGLWVFAQEQPGDQDFEDNEWLHMIFTHAAHPIASAREFKFNDDFKGDLDGRVVLKNYLSGATVADQYLLDNCPDFKENMIGKGLSWFRCSLRYNQDVFPSGIPNINCIKQGKAILDLRTGITSYSNNPAMILYDYLRTRLKWEDDLLILDSFIAAANICDEPVTKADGTIGKRYTINCEFDDSEKPLSVLDSMLAACGGEWIRVGGRLGLHVAAYYGSADIELTSDMITGGIQIQPEVERSDAFNVARGGFVDPNQDYSFVDYPEVRVDDWVVEDEEEIVLDVDFKYVTDPDQAQRLAAISMRRARFAMTLKVNCTMQAFNFTPGTMVILSLPEIGFVDTEFMVTDWSFSLQDGVSLTIRREDPDFYDDDVSREITVPPLINLPTGGVPAPQNALFTSKEVGDVVQGVIQWTNTASMVAYTNVIVKDSNGVAVVSAQVPFPSDEIPLNGRLSGAYTAELISVGVNGVKSQSTVLNFLIEAPLKPDFVSIRSSNWNVNLIPGYDNVVVPYGTLFEINYLSDNASFLSNPPTYDASDFDLSEQLTIASSYNHGGLTPDRWQHYWIRAINSYGSSDWLYVQTGTTKEQDLVTTVVERLQAIEILSANWDEGAGLAGNYANGAGYKLFAPDPSDPTADGRAVFNDIYARGRIVATSGSFTGALYANTGTMNNVTINENCTIKGTLKANQIQGDVINGGTGRNQSVTLQNQETKVAFQFRIVNPLFLASFVRVEFPWFNHSPIHRFRLRTSTNITIPFKGFRKESTPSLLINVPSGFSGYVYVDCYLDFPAGGTTSYTIPSTDGWFVMVGARSNNLSIN